MSTLKIKYFLILVYNINGRHNILRYNNGSSLNDYMPAVLNVKLLQPIIIHMNRHTMLF